MSSRRKQKPREANLIAENRIDWWGLGIVGLVALLLFYPPYFQALFFAPHIFINHIITALVFILVWIDKYRRRDFSFISSPLDWAIIAYAIAYALSLINAVHIGDAVYGFLKALNYFMIYWIVSQVIRDNSHIKIILKAIIFSGLGVALIALLVPTGLIDYSKGIIDNHIASTMGYHNALAAFLSVVTLLSVSLLMNEKNRWWQAFYCVANYIMLLVTLAAVSKGAWIILIFGLFLLIIGMPRGYRLKIIYFFGITIGTAIIISNYFMAAIASESPIMGVWFTMAGIPVVMAGWIVWGLIERWMQKQQISRNIVIALVSLVLIGAIFTVTQMGLSNQLVQEIGEIADLENLSYVTRADFMIWAVDIVKDYPVFGAGAGGWNALYKQYQEYDFATTETHSHILQVWVEAGTMGLIAFVAIWILFCYLLYNLYKSYRGREEWVLIWGIAVAAMGLGLHSCFDFDLSMPSMAILLWSLFALISSQNNVSSHERIIKYNLKWVNVVMACILAFVLLIPSAQYLSAYKQANQGQQALQSAQSDQNQAQAEQLNRAAIYFSQAIQNDSLNADYWSQFGSIQGYFYRILDQQGHQQAAIHRSQSIAAMNKAADLKPYDPQMTQILVENAAQIGDLDGIIRFGKLTVKGLPNNPEVYSKMAQLWWNASQKCVENDQHDMAVKFAEEIINLEKDLQQQLVKVNIDHPFWQGEKLAVTPDFETACQQAREFLDNQ